MPHAALWVVQRQLLNSISSTKSVSMPHAALWVVQLSRLLWIFYLLLGFNAARGFVGGAALSCGLHLVGRRSFNAARGFVGGAAYQPLRA